MNNFLESELKAKEFIETSLGESLLKDIEKALNSITKLLKSFNISFTFLGGIARNEYAPSRTTEDIDILIDKKDFEKMKQLPIGYIKDISNGRGRMFKLHEPNTNIDILYSGEKAGNNQGIVYENPISISEFHGKFPFITLKNLIRYKLSSGIYGKRYKDFGDIQDLIITNKLNINYAKENNFRLDLVDQYEKIWYDTEKMNKEDKNK